jgi:hypothetical protein
MEKTGFAAISNDAIFRARRASNRQIRTARAEISASTPISAAMLSSSLARGTILSPPMHRRILVKRGSADIQQ